MTNPTKARFRARTAGLRFGRARRVPRTFERFATTSDYNLGVQDLSSRSKG